MKFKYIYNGQVYKILILDFEKNFVYLDIGEEVQLRVKYDEYKLITV